LYDGHSSSTDSIIDLRSDTLTQPTAEMRAAMSTAEVGDDVYGEDPTVNRLEARAAELLGREAALFVPTGTMGNQIAIRLHTRPGQEILCESRSHILDWEMGMAAVFSGATIRPVMADRGILTWSHIEPVIFGRGSTNHASTGLIEIENTANLAGGTVTPLSILEEIWVKAGERKLPVHLDGARIFNAATTLVPELGGDVYAAARVLTAGFDTVMFCLSKGLCAPVGSMLVGGKDAIAEGRIYRKALGGGMRQAGILAAAGLIALEKMPLRLGEDHANARAIAERLSESAEFEIDLANVQTNILIVRMKTQKAADFAARLKARGILISSVGPAAVRLVTHHDVDTKACLQAAEAMLQMAR
jgi:threonine aldolase